MRTPEGLPPWPTEPPTAGSVLLRPFRPNEDEPMVQDLATDPYVPLIGTLPASATKAQATDWIVRNLARWSEGRGFSFAIAQINTGEGVGAAGLWLAELASGRATAGYSVAPRHRGHGYAADALTALTSFAWTLLELHRVELYIESGNASSIRTAECAGYACEGLLRSHQEIGGRRRDMLLYATTRPTEPDHPRNQAPTGR